MELWRGTMTAHSLVIGRDHGGPRTPIGFDDERWKALCADSSALHIMRSGAAAAGRRGGTAEQEPSVPRPDPSDRRSGKRMFDRINGRRSIEEIAAGAGGDDASRRAPMFFEKLWRYDQVTFDASAALPAAEPSRQVAR